MKYFRTKVTPVRVQAICDCGGLLQYTGETLMSNPPKYTYQCKECHDKFRLDGLYPKIEFDGDDEKEEE